MTTAIKTSLGLIIAFYFALYGFVRRIQVMAIIQAFIPSSMTALLTTRTFTLIWMTLPVVATELVALALWITSARSVGLALSIGIADPSFLTLTLAALTHALACRAAIHARTTFVVTHAAPVIGIRAHSCFGAILIFGAVHVDLAPVAIRMTFAVVATELVVLALWITSARFVGYTISIGCAHRARRAITTVRVCEFTLAIFAAYLVVLTI